MLTQEVNELEYALIVLWELLEHQAPLLEGRESETFSALLRVRYCAETSVCSAIPSKSSVLNVITLHSR